MKFLTTFLTAILLSISTVRAEEVKIVALVNGEMISNQDIQNRINAFLLTSNIPLNDQTKNIIVQKVLHGAIDEKIKLQAAQKEGVNISDKEIDNAVRQFETNNKIPSGELKNILKKGKVNMSTFRDQIKSDLAWVRLVKKKTMNDGITQKELEKAMEEARHDLNEPKFMVSEIFIKKEKAKDLNILVNKLREDPRFDLYALQFSDSASASKGGSLGWINKEKLATPLEKALDKLKEGQVSDPVFLNNGYYILKLEKTFNPKKDKPQMPTQDEMRNFLTNQKMEDFAQKYLQDLRQNAVIELRN